jgi:serine/threonine protein kinase
VVLDLFSRVLGAVDYLHHRPSPFLHLDLKPDNVLVASRPEGPEPVLIDFGIARRWGGKGLKAYTPPYGAPEQESGGTLDCSTDVYALGQMLKEVLEILKGLPEPVAKAVAAVVEKATRPSRRERYADAAEMRIAFRRSLLAKTTPQPGTGMLPLWSRLPRWTLPAGAAGLGFVLLLLFFAMGGTSEGPNLSEPAQESATPSEEEKERFTQLQYRFEEALIEGEPNAETYFRAAYDLSDKVPAGSEIWNWMKQELDTMSAHLSQAQSGGQEGEELRAVLRQKHLTYQKP